MLHVTCSLREDSLTNFDVVVFCLHFCKNTPQISSGSVINTIVITRSLYLFEISEESEDFVF